MVFGHKKDKAQVSEPVASAEVAQVAETSSARSGQKKRKPAELLASVVNESAIGAAIDIMKRNEAFALPNGTAWVGLLLAVDDIGGLNQKQKSDAAKGSIIELIAADKIQVVATRAMLDEEYLGIIPTAETLERMDEYSLLTEAPYFWGVFYTEDGGNSLIADAVQNLHATYAEAVAVARGESTLANLLPEVWTWAGGINEPVLSEEPVDEFERVLVGAAVGGAGATAAPDLNPLADAFVPDSDEDVDYASLADLDTGVVNDDEPALDFDEARFEAEFAPEPSLDGDEDDHRSFTAGWQDDDEDTTDPLASDDEPEDEESADGYFQYLEDNRDRVVDEQEVRETIARRFLSNDLDLVVDLAEFERLFATDAQTIGLEIAADASDWLSSQVAQLSRQANAELRMLHQGNIDELRQLFVETMALHVERTMAEVSTDAPGSQYAALMDGAKRDFEALRAAAPQEVAEARREITARFEAAADSRAEQAAAHARAVYRDKNLPKLERDLAEAGVDLDRRHEEQYAHDRKTVLDMRRKDANVRMDVGTNRIFEALRERQVEQRESERELLQRWNNQLFQFIDENRKSDIARSAALADDLARVNKVKELENERKVELRDLRREHADREQGLRDELIRIRQEAVAELTSRQASWDTAIEVERERTRAGSALIDQLQTQVTTLGAQYEGQYQNRIATLEADKIASAQMMDRQHTMQKRSTFLLVALAVVLTLAAGAVGIEFGWSVGHSQVTQSAPSTPAAVPTPQH